MLKPREKAAIYKMLSDTALITLCWAIKTMLFGYDDDDKKRFIY